MNKRTSLAAALAFVLSASFAVAVTTDGATARDLQRLQAELNNLDDSLAALPANSTRANEFRDRADEIRDDLTYLKVEMRRYQRNGRQGLGVTAQEVEDLRREIAALRDDIEGSSGVQSSRIEVPEGTEIQVRLDQPLSSRTARVEDRFDASVVQPLRTEGILAIPAGTRVRGIVRAVERAERPLRGGRLEVEFDQIEFSDRTRTPMRSRVISLRENIDQGGTAQKAGLGAVLGAVIGKVIGGTKGALVGLIVGGTGGIAASKGEEVEMPEGTILTLRLDRPLPITRR